MSRRLRVGGAISAVVIAAFLGLWLACAVSQGRLLWLGFL